MSQSSLSNTTSCGLILMSPRNARITRVALSTWLLIVLALGVRLAYQSVFGALALITDAKVSTQAEAAFAPGASNPVVTFAGAALTVYAIIALGVLATQRVRPRWTAAASVLVPLAIFVLAAISTQQAVAAISAVVLLLTSWTAGDLARLALRLPLSGLPPSASTSIRIATGLGLLGTAVLILGAFNGISALPLLALAVVTNLVWAVVHWRSLRNRIATRSVSILAQPRLEWFEALLLALSVAFFTFATLASLTPETIYAASDAVRQHLPQAREIWQDHAVLVYPTIETPSASVLGASLNAVAFGVGGITAVRIFQVLVSLCCVLAIAGLGALLAGRLAGIAGAACFSCTPLVLWLTGHAYPDLLAVLFICTSLQCVICWQNDGHRVWLILAGTLAGFSLATKQISAVVVLALLIALAITARKDASITERVLATVLVAVACAVTTIPWFVRSVVLVGSLPLVGTVLGQLANVPGLGMIRHWLPAIAVPLNPPGTVASDPVGGVSRTLAGIITGPWDLTFQGAYANWRIARYGELGILFLMFLPLTVVNLCSRGAILLALTSAISFIGWVFTIQVPRHLLPGLALLAVLAGIAIANATNTGLTLERTPFARLVQACAIAGLALTPLYFLPNVSAGFPITVITGQSTPDEYMVRVDPATPALTAATTLLPADTRVGYIGQWQGAQSSTEARLIYLGQYSTDEGDSLDTQVGDSPEAIFQTFAKWGISYFIWDRPDTRPQDVDTVLLSGDFLLRYTTILGGDNGIYLFAVHPDGVPNATQQNNLLQDPTFSSLRKTRNIWNGTRKDLGEDGVLQPRRQVEVSQRVPISPRTPYLMVLTGSCASPLDQTRVTLQWLDATQSTLSSTSDTLTLGTKDNSALMWRMSPDTATAVDVSISTAAGSPCAITRIGLYEDRDAQEDPT